MNKPINQLLQSFVARHGAPCRPMAAVTPAARVYVLNRAIDMEGEETLGVFAGEQAAINAAKRRADSELQSFIDVRGETYWAEESYSSEQFYVRAFPVR